jgi:hypothetical protein
VRRLAALILLAGCNGGDVVEPPDAAPPDARPRSSLCTGCGDHEVCEGGPRECVAYGASACGDRLSGQPSLLGYPFASFGDLYMHRDIRTAPFDGTRTGTVTATTASTVTVSLQEWGTRTVEYRRDDVPALFQTGDAVTLRFCVEQSPWLIDLPWMVELDGPRAGLVATGLAFHHHSRCLPSGVVRMDHGPTDCAPVDGAGPGVLLAVPVEMEFDGGTVVRAFAGEQVATPRGRLAVLASFVVGDATCVDCFSGVLQLAIER